MKLSPEKAVELFLNDVKTRMKEKVKNAIEGAPSCMSLIGEESGERMAIYFIPGAITDEVNSLLDEACGRRKEEGDAMKLIDPEQN